MLSKSCQVRRRCKWRRLRHSRVRFHCRRSIYLLYLNHLHLRRLLILRPDLSHCHLLRGLIYHPSLHYHFPAVARNGGEKSLGVKILQLNDFISTTSRQLFRVPPDSLPPSLLLWLSPIGNPSLHGKPAKNRFPNQYLPTVSKRLQARSC